MPFFVDSVSVFTDKIVFVIPILVFLFAHHLLTFTLVRQKTTTILLLLVVCTIVQVFMSNNCCLL